MDMCKAGRHKSIVHYKSRMSKHKTQKKKTYISNAIRKYGWDNFKKEIIIDDVPEEDLSNLETSYIKLKTHSSRMGTI